MNKNIIIAAGAAVILFAVGGYFVIRNSATQEDITPTPGGTNQMPVNPMGAGLNSGENPMPGSQVHDLPAEPAAVLARADLAKNLGVDEKSIVIMLVEEKEWSDGCLGLGGPAESCLAAITPGFRVELVSKGQTYVYRTDKTGGSLRIEVNTK